MGWKFKAAFAAILLLIAVLLPPADPGKLLELQAGKVLDAYLGEALELYLPPGGKPPPEPMRLSFRSLTVNGPQGEQAAQALARHAREWARGIHGGRAVVLTDRDPDLILRAQFTVEPGGFRWRLSAEEESPYAPRPLERRQGFLLWLGLLPPFAAILVALLLENAIWGLLAGAFLGAWLLATPGLPELVAGGGAGDLGGRLLDLAGNLAGALPEGARILGWDILIEQSLLKEDKQQILGFVFFLCAAVGVMTRMGGTLGLVDLIRRRATTARSAQLAAYLMGLAIFFDDYANTIVVGNTMRPLTDRLRVAREKLAYIVDSTSAPVAGIAVLSTWVAFEVSTFSPQLPEVGIPAGDGYRIFLATLPFRFYCLFTLLLVLLTVVLRREIGPMLGACRRALATGELVRPGGHPLVAEAFTRLSPRPDVRPRAMNVILPIVLMLAVTVAEIGLLGQESVAAIFHASIVAFLAAVLLALGQRLLSPREILIASALAVRSLLFAFAILLLAWAIGSVCQGLDTAGFLVASFAGAIRPELLPLILFLAACLISFSTGSSWSTMAVLLPNVVVLAWALGAESHLGSPGLLVLAIGAVLEGAIFGDHCSPISDTTILSSVASASDHLDHTRTQLPYALVSMLTAIGAGYLPAALLGRSWVWLCLPGGAAAMVLFLLLAGRDPEAGLKTVRPPAGSS